MKLTFVVIPEGGQFMGRCMQLGLATSGKTHEEARRRIHKATHIVIEAARGRGELEALMVEKGIEE